MKVVLCDDHRLLIEALAELLSARGWDIAALTVTPDDGVSAVATHDPDVCVMDVAFQSGDGIDATRRIVESGARTRVLMLSAASSPDVVGAALAAGATGFIRKDSDIAAIVEAVERVRAGQVAVDPALLRTALTTRAEVADRPDEAMGLRFLTPREHQVLQLLVDGHGTADIARTLGVSVSTARTHIQNVLTKLGVHSRLAAAALVARIASDEPSPGGEPSGRAEPPGSAGS